MADKPSKGVRQPTSSTERNPGGIVANPAGGLLSPSGKQVLIDPVHAAVTKPKSPGVAQVLQRQRLLKAAGFKIVVDGIWGPRTQKAWRRYKSGFQPNRTPTISAQEQERREAAPSVAYFTTNAKDKPPATNADKARALKNAPFAGLDAAAQRAADRKKLKAAKLASAAKRKADYKKMMSDARLYAEKPQAAVELSLHELTGLLASPESPLRDFKDGRGQGVKAIQYWLDSKGYRVNITGVFDKQTFDALQLAEKRAKNFQISRARRQVADLYESYAWNPGETSPVFSVLGGRIPAVKTLARMIADPGSMTGQILAKNIAKFIDGGDAVAWDYAMRVELLSRANRANPFTYSSVMYRLLGDKAAGMLTDGQVLHDILMTDAIPELANRDDVAAQMQQVRAETIRRAQIRAIANSTSQTDLSGWDHGKMLTYMAVEEQKYQRRMNELSSQQPWWVDALDSLSVPMEYTLTGAVVGVDTILARATGGPSVEWEDAQAQVGLESEDYRGDMMMAGPLAVTLGHFVIDPLNFVFPLKFASALARGSGMLFGRGVAKTLGREQFAFGSTMGHYKLVGRPETFWNQAQVWNRMPTLGKELRYEKGAWSKADAVRAIPGVERLTETPGFAKVQKAADHFTRLKNTSVTNAGRRSEVQMRRFFNGNGLKYIEDGEKTVMKYRKLNSVLGRRIEAALSEGEAAFLNHYRSVKIADEMGRNSESLFLTDTGSKLSNVGDAVFARYMAEQEVNVTLRFATEAAQEYLEKNGYWTLRQRIKKAPASDQMPPPPLDAGTYSPYTPGKGLSKERRRSDPQPLETDIALLRQIEEGAAAKFQEVWGGAEASYLGGAAANEDIAEQIRNEVGRLGNIFRNSYMPVMQRRIEATAAKEGKRIFDDRGLWAMRYESKASKTLRELGIEAFDKPVMIPNPAYRHPFTHIQMQRQVRREVRNLLSRNFNYAERRRVGEFTGTKDFEAEERRLMDEVGNSWDERDGMFYDTRTHIEVPDIYARKWERMRRDVDSLRTNKAYIGDWLGAMAENPMLAKASMGELWMGDIAWTLGGRWSKRGMRGISMRDSKGQGSAGYASHLPEDIRMRSYSPTDSAFGFGAAREGDAAEGALAKKDRDVIAGAFDELYRQQALAADYVMKDELLRQGAWFQSLAKQQNKALRLAYKTATWMMRTWTFFTLPLRMGWFVRNNIDNAMKAMIAGVHDPRLLFMGAANPGQGTANFFEGQINVLIEAASFLDGLFGTSVAPQMQWLLDEVMYANGAKVLKRVFDIYDIPVDEAGLQEMRFLTFDRRVATNPHLLEANPMTGEVGGNLTPRQQRAYNEGFHDAKDRLVDDWYAENSSLKQQIQGHETDYARLDDLRGELDELEKTANGLRAKMTVPAVKGLRSLDDLNNRLRRKKRLLGKQRDTLHKLMVKTKGEITEEATGLQNNILRLDSEVQKLKTLRNTIRDNPEVVDLMGQLADLHQRRLILAEQIKEISGRLSKVDRPHDFGLPYKEIEKQAREEAWEAVKALGRRSDIAQSWDDFKDGMWHLFGQTPEAYFRRIIYRNTYVKHMKKHQAYMISVEKEAAEFRARIEEEEMKHREALAGLAVVETSRAEALRIVKEVEAMQKAQQVFQIHPFYVNPNSIGDFYVSPVWAFSMDPDKVSQVAGRQMGADLRSFRNIWPDRVRAGQDKVRGYIVTRNGEVVDVRVTKIDADLGDKPEAQFPKGGSMDKEMRTDRIGGLGPDFDFVREEGAYVGKDPETGEEIRGYSKGSKFEPVTRNIDTGKIDADAIARRIRADIRANYGDDPRFNPSKWSAPDHVTLSTADLEDAQWLREQKAKLIDTKDEFNLANDELRELYVERAAIRDASADFDLADLPISPEVKQAIRDWDATPFRRRQEILFEIDRTAIGVNDAFNSAVREYGERMTRLANDLRGLDELMSNVSVAIMEAERRVSVLGDRLGELTGKVSSEEGAAAKIAERQAKFIKRLYDEYTLEEVSEAQARLLLANDELAITRAKLAAINGVLGRREKKLREYYGKQGVRSKGDLHLEAHHVAWKKVEDTLFDYDKITNIEDNFRFFFPFIQFWRKNTAWWAKTMVSKPGVPAAIDKFEDEMERWNEDVPTAIQRYIRLSEVMPYMPDGLRGLMEDIGFSDFAFDPINLTSFAPMWRLLKQENPLLRPEDAGNKVFAPMIEFMQDSGLGFAPWVYQPLSIAGIANQRSWMTVFPQQSLLTALTRTYYHDLDKRLAEMDGGWERVVGYLLMGTEPAEIADNFEYWVNTEMVGQRERGEPMNRELAEQVIRDVFYLQQMTTYFGGVWLRRVNASDVHLLHLQQDLRENESDNFTPDEWDLVRLWGKRGWSRDAFDEYTELLPGINAYYSIDDFDESEDFLKENPEILPHIRRKGTKPWVPYQWDAILNMTKKADNSRFWKVAESLDRLTIDGDALWAAKSLFVTKTLEDYWAENDTPKEQRDKMIRAASNAYYQRLNTDYFAIPDTDYAAKDEFMELHPDLTTYWQRNNDLDDDYRAIWNGANADLRETWANILNAGKGDNWDAANAFLKQFPFMFEGTKTANKVTATGEWKVKSEKGRAYRKVKPMMDWFFKDYMKRVGAKEAFNWLFSNPDDDRAKAILDYLKKYGKNSAKIIDLLKAWEWLRVYWSMDKKARNEWLSNGSEGAKIVKAYFDKWASPKGDAQGAKDYDAVKHILKRYENMTKEQRRAFLDSGTKDAAALLGFFKKYGKKHQMERAFKALAKKHPWIDDSTPEMRLRMKFWQTYFSLTPDQRPAFVMENAEAHGVFIYGEWGDKERHDAEQEWMRRSVGVGASKRMADYLYVKPLADFYFNELKNASSAEKDIFLRLNPELKQYLDKYADRPSTGSKATDKKIETYFNLPYNSPQREQYLASNPEVKAFLNRNTSPADRAMYALADQYFSLPESSRPEFAHQHPELVVWFERAKDARSAINAQLGAFDDADPRLSDARDQLKQFEEWAVLTRRRLRTRAIESLLSEDIEDSRSRKPLAQ